MNRLAPLIARAPARSAPARFAEIGAPILDLAAPGDDFRTFAIAFAGGLIFFGTLFF